VDKNIRIGTELNGVRRERQKEKNRKQKMSVNLQSRCVCMLENSTRT